MGEHMKNCHMTDQIMDLLDFDPDDAKTAEIKNHLRECPQCQREAHKIRSIHKLLDERKRPAAPNAIRRAYERRLQEIFPVLSIWQRMAAKSRAVIPAWMTGPHPHYRLIGAVVILCIGILIGRFALKPAAIHTRTISIVSETPESRVPRSDFQLISQFLTQSEIWLLEIANSPVNGSASHADLLTNREIAAALLQKSLFIEKKAEDLNHESLIVFLNQLEMVLLETSGVQDEELSRAFNEIKQTIRETALLYEIKRIRHSIRALPGEEA